MNAGMFLEAALDRAFVNKFPVEGRHGSTSLASLNFQGVYQIGDV